MTVAMGVRTGMGKKERGRDEGSGECSGFSHGRMCIGKRVGDFVTSVEACKKSSKTCLENDEVTKL